jgi:hypothetical protein
MDDKKNWAAKYEFIYVDNLMKYKIKIKIYLLLNNKIIYLILKFLKNDSYL